MPTYTPAVLSPAGSSALSGPRTVLVTGAASGIGYQTARLLAIAGMSVIVHARNGARAQEAVEQLVRDGADRSRLDTAVADFAHLDDVADMAHDVIRRHPRLDLLVNNAAVLGPPGRALTDEGNELSFQVNFLAHFLLTRMLEPTFAASPAPRVVNVSSALHRTGSINWTDPTRSRGYSQVAAYAQSKLALTIFARAFTEYGRSAATAVSVHPGVVSTRLLPCYGTVGRPASEGAAAVTHLCSTATKVAPGAYYDRLAVAEPGPKVGESRTMGRLWKLGTDLTGQA
ncbi:SDR family NAD(P)-dependent oxidoreductase [Embleya sp. NPDC059259]|uniref:SDR family NAD(P)-dependent oxidoreductase n=1 Tax=unclassified Embleya TaxID=2699296 RepID=UPI00368A2D52